jgi:hypothetical protein
MDPIEYAKKIIFSYESDLAFAGPPTSIIRPMLRGHRFYDSLIRVVSRLPATTALSAKTALDVVRKPLENLQGGREFFNIIELSNRGTLPPELLSKIEKFGAYAAKYVSQTAGIVFLTEKLTADPQGNTGLASAEAYSEERLLKSIAKDTESLAPYLQLAEGMAQSVIYDDFRSFYSNIQQSSDWENLKLGAQKLLERIRTN